MPITPKHGIDHFAFENNRKLREKGGSMMITILSPSMFYNAGSFHLGELIPINKCDQTKDHCSCTCGGRHAKWPES